MSTPNLGAGLAPIGSSPVGFGTPAAGDTYAAALLRKPDGTRGDCCAINPVTGDYTLDEAGNKVGGDSIPQMVYLALRTAKGSSCIPAFGIGAFPKTIGDDIEQRMTDLVTAALAALLDAKIIELVEVNVSRFGSGGVSVDVQWRDLVTGQIQSTFV